MTHNESKRFTKNFATTSKKGKSKVSETYEMPRTWSNGVLEYWAIECTHKLKLSGNKLQNCNLKILNLVDIL